MSDPRKGGVWGDHTRAGQPWTDDEDDQLMRWGMAAGYDFVAGHDLGREPREGSERIEWLRENKAAVVKYVEDQMNWEADQTEPRDMRRKKNRRRIN